MDEEYRVRLANPSAIRQYEGLKHTDDKWDAFWLAHMLRLGILPVGHIYPKEERPLRDLLRRRMFFVRQRTALILSLQGMTTRNLGVRLSGNKIKSLTEHDAEEMFGDRCLVISAKSSVTTIRSLAEEIRGIEREIVSHAKLRPEFELLQTIPGIGMILALTIMLEAGDIGRFEKVGNYSSYCRCVNSERISNDKLKGRGNAKNGNKYLSWAYVEAANFAIRHSAEARKFWQRKMAKTNRIVATKALANKLARASYYIIRDRIPFDSEKLFGK
jgi:transposase